MRVLFINDSASNPNWGDRAAAVSLRRMITAAGGEITHTITEAQLWESDFRPPNSSPDTAHETTTHRLARLCTPPAFVSVARRWSVRQRESAAARLLPDDGDALEAAARRIARERRFGWPVVLGAMRDADIAVIHGGSIDGSGPVPRSNLFLGYLMAEKFRKPAVLVNHTADLADPRLRRMAARVYPLLADVVYRDPLSAEKHAESWRGRYAPDSAFWFRPAEREAWAPIASRPSYFDVFPHVAGFDPSRPYLCLGGSSILWAGWDPPRLVRSFAALVAAIRGVYEGQIVLLAADTPDQEILQELAARHALPLIGVTTPVQQAVDIVGNSDAYVGGRWHTGIFALRGGTPVVALSSKTFKMRALMRSAGLPETPFDSLRLAEEAPALAHRLSETLAQGDELRVRLRTWAERQAEDAWGNVASLRDWPSRAKGPYDDPTAARLREGSSESLE